MKLLLNTEEIRKAVRQYVQSEGYILRVPKTVNQNTGLMFYWDNNNSDKLRVEVKLREKK